jgi:SAM-dependent methyltransferase
MSYARLRQTLRRGLRFVPAALRAPLARLGRRLFPAAPAALPQGAVDDAAYAARVAAEQAHFADQIDVHALPEIFHYWSVKNLAPLLAHFGYAHPEDFFAVEIAKRQRAAGRPIRVVSLGAGNCDAEVRIAQMLVERGISAFTIEALDINPAMLERGMALATGAGVADQVRPLRGDFNRWKPEGRYDVVMANQALHHVLELEHLFDRIRESLHADGVFITSDMIGRNGHMRWPEALERVHAFWRELPQSHRYNHQLQRHEPLYENWDCAQEGFEGVRAQDILPLLIERFSFDTFIAWGNLIDVFIDRGFGHNFDARNPADQVIIDRIHERDHADLMAGHIKPTHMIAVMRTSAVAQPRVWQHMTPEFCVRRPD